MSLWSGNSGGEYGTLYNPFGFNYIPNYVEPSYGGGGIISIGNHQIPAIDEPLYPIDQNTMQPKGKKQFVSDLQVSPVVSDNTPIPYTLGNTNDLLKKGKQFIKDNPFLSIAISAGLIWALTGKGKGK